MKLFAEATFFEGICVNNIHLYYLHCNKSLITSCQKKVLFAVFFCKFGNFFKKFMLFSRSSEKPKSILKSTNFFGIPRRKESASGFRNYGPFSAKRSLGTKFSKKLRCSVHVLKAQYFKFNIVSAFYELERSNFRYSVFFAFVNSLRYY